MVEVRTCHRRFRRGLCVGRLASTANADEFTRVVGFKISTLTRGPVGNATDNVVGVCAKTLQLYIFYDTRVCCLFFLLSILPRGKPRFHASRTKK